MTEIAGKAGATSSEPIRYVSERRPCARCGYDLRGQPVHAEATYDWAIVRCPECGFVAPMHACGASRRVWAFGASVAATAWVFASLGSIAALGLGMFGIAQSAMVVTIAGPYWYDYTEWAPIDGALETFWATPLSLGVWVLLACLMPGLRRERRRILLAVSILVMAIGWVSYFWMLSDWTVGRYGYEVYGSATQQVAAIGWRIGMMTSAFVLFQTWVMMELARPAMRWALPRFAPHWVVLAFAELWSADGIEPPIGEAP